MTNYACNQNSKNISISQPANLVKTIWTCDTKRTYEASTMCASIAMKINKICTAGVLCTLFFSHIYTTVHDKIRSMTKYAALLCKAPETCHRLAAFHETM